MNTTTLQVYNTTPNSITHEYTIMITLHSGKAITREYFAASRKEAEQYAQAAYGSLGHVHTVQAAREHTAMQLIHDTADNKASMYCILQDMGTAQYVYINELYNTKMAERVAAIDSSYNWMSLFHYEPQTTRLTRLL